MGRTGHIRVLQPAWSLHIICAWHLAHNVIPRVSLSTYSVSDFMQCHVFRFLSIDYERTLVWWCRCIYPPFFQPVSRCAAVIRCCKWWCESPTNLMQMMLLNTLSVTFMIATFWRHFPQTYSGWFTNFGSDHPQLQSTITNLWLHWVETMTHNWCFWFDHFEWIASNQVLMCYSALREWTFILNFFCRFQ